MGNRSLQKRIIEGKKAIEPPHPMMSNTFVFVEKGSSKLRAQWPYINQQTYQKWKQNYLFFLKNVFESNNFEQISHPIAKHLFLPLKHQYQKVNVCNPSGIVIMEYQLIEKTLVDDIEERRKENLPYLQHQLWSLLDILSNLMTFLHEKNIFLGDVRCQNVLIGSQNEIKLSTNISWVGEPNLQTKLQNNWQLFITQQILQLHNKTQKIDDKIKKQNNDYQIGMILAQSILLEDLSKIYNQTKTKKELNKQRYIDMKERLLKIKYYSPKLLLIVAGMIQLSTQKRIAIRDICKLLGNQQQYQNISRQRMVQCLGEKYQQLEQKLYNINQKKSISSFGKKFYSASYGQTQPSQKQEKSCSDMSSMVQYPIRKQKNWYQDIKLDDFVAISQNKQIQNKFNPTTYSRPDISKKLYDPSLSLNICEEQKNMDKNFSFNSLTSPQQNQIKTMMKHEPNSFGKSTQTLLIAPSVYSVSNPPQSYISYHYTKSLQKNDVLKQKDIQKSNQPSFQLQQEIPIAKWRKQSERKNHEILIQDLKRRTVSVDIANRERKQENQY